MEKNSEENSKTRLLQFLSYLDMGQGKFEKFVEISNGYINNNKGGIGADILNKITSKYPELNLYWIVTGKGRMLLREDIAVKKEIDYYKDEYIKAMEKLDKFRDDFDQLKAEHETLKKSQSPQLGGTSDASTAQEEAV